MFFVKQFISFLIISSVCLKRCFNQEIGACKFTTLTIEYDMIDVDTFGEDIPPGFQLYTNIEIDILENKYSQYLPFEHHLNVSYELYDLTSVYIMFFDNNKNQLIGVSLGEKYSSMATLIFDEYGLKTKHIKYNRYFPDLPTFPYFLHFQITTGGAFSVYTVGNTRPFFEYDLGNFKLTHMALNAETDNLIGFYDCSSKPYCGVHRQYSLHDCRMQVKNDYGSRIYPQVNRDDGALFDDYFVVDENGAVVTYTSNEDEELFIKISRGKIHVNYIGNTAEGVLFEYPPSPYFVRIRIDDSTFNNLTIFNMHNDTVVQMWLEGSFLSVQYFEIDAVILYSDCVTAVPEVKRVERYKVTGTNIQAKYLPYGKDYTKSLLYYKDYDHMKMK